MIFPEGDYNDVQKTMIDTAENSIPYFGQIIEKMDEFPSLLLTFAPDLDTQKLEPKIHDVSPYFAREMDPLRDTLLKATVAIDRPVYIFLISEAWTLPQDAIKGRFNEDGSVKEGVKPVREDDRRISILAVNGESVFGDHVSATFRINEKDKPRTLDIENPMTVSVGSEDDENYKVGGRLTRLLPRFTRPVPS